MNKSEPKLESTSEGVGTPERPRQPYHKPQLRRLGSVRDLTLGSKGSAGDNGLTYKNRKGPK